MYDEYPVREGAVVYTDKFEVGDVVTWRDAEWAVLGSRLNSASGWREYASGKILEVIGRSSDFRAMGHTQHVKVEGLGEDWWSGAYFRKSASILPAIEAEASKASELTPEEN